MGLFSKKETARPPLTRSVEYETRAATATWKTADTPELEARSTSAKWGSVDKTARTSARAPTRTTAKPPAALMVSGKAPATTKVSTKQMKKGVISRPDPNMAMRSPSKASHQHRKGGSSSGTVEKQWVTPGPFKVGIPKVEYSKVSKISKTTTGGRGGAKDGDKVPGINNHRGGVVFQNIASQTNVNINFGGIVNLSAEAAGIIWG